MNYNINYQELFSLNLFHHYFLDVGDSSYDDTVSPVPFSKEKVTQYLSIEPSQATQKMIRGYRLVLKSHNLGISCLLQAVDNKPRIDLSGSKLEFLIRIKDPLFEKYTELNNDVAGLYFFPFDSGRTETQIKKLNETAAALQDYKIPYSDGAYETAIANLKGSETKGLFGLVSVKPKEMLMPVMVDSVTEYHIPASPEQFKVVFKSRETVWRYRLQDDSVDFETKALPFVKNGSITPVDGDDNEKQYPMASPSDRFVYSSDKSQIITEIYI